MKTLHRIWTWVRRHPIEIIGVTIVTVAGLIIVLTAIEGILERNLEKKPDSPIIFDLIKNWLDL